MIEANPVGPGGGGGGGGAEPEEDPQAKAKRQGGDGAAAEAVAGAARRGSRRARELSMSITRLTGGDPIQVHITLDDKVKELKRKIKERRGPELSRTRK